MNDDTQSSCQNQTDFLGLLIFNQALKHPIKNLLNDFQSVDSNLELAQHPPDGTLHTSKFEKIAVVSFHVSA